MKEVLEKDRLERRVEDFEQEGPATQIASLEEGVFIDLILLYFFADYEKVMSDFCREMLVFYWYGIGGFVG